MSVQAMDPVEQERLYGFSYPPLPERGVSAATDAALDMVARGVEPALIRELDAWTGKTHFQYSTPGGPSGNVNIWERVNGEWRWRNQSGELVSTAPTWAGNPPSGFDEESGQYDIQRAVSVQYPGGQTVTLTNPQYAPAATPQPDTKAGVTRTSVPAGSNTTPETKGNTASTMTLDEQIQGAALASSGRTELGWDEWGFYYRQITGESAPSPEDAGFARAADGSVILAGKRQYPYAVWSNAAFGTGGAGAFDTGGAGGTGTGGTGAGGTGAGGTGAGGTGAGTPGAGLDWITNLLAWLVSFLIGGSTSAVQRNG